MDPFAGEFVCSVGWPVVDEIVAHVEVLVVAEDEPLVGGSIKTEMLMYSSYFV